MVALFLKRIQLRCLNALIHPARVNFQRNLETSFRCARESSETNEAYFERSVSSLAIYSEVNIEDVPAPS